MLTVCEAGVKSSKPKTRRSNRKYGRPHVTILRRCGSIIESPSLLSIRRLVQIQRLLWHSVSPTPGAALRNTPAGAPLGEQVVAEFRRRLGDPRRSFRLETRLAAEERCPRTRMPSGRQRNGETAAGRRRWPLSGRRPPPYLVVRHLPASYTGTGPRPPMPSTHCLGARWFASEAVGQTHGGLDRPTRRHAGARECPQRDRRHPAHPTSSPRLALRERGLVEPSAVSGTTRSTRQRSSSTRESQKVNVTEFHIRQQHRV